MITGAGFFCISFYINFFPQQELINKSSREYILSMLGKAKENAPKIISSFVRTIEPIAQTYIESKNNAEEKKKLLATYAIGHKDRVLVC